MSFYSDLQTLSQNLIKEFGGPVSYVQRVKSTYTSAAGQTWTETTTVMNAVLSKFRQVGSQTEQGTFLLIGDNSFSFTPDTEDFFLINTEKFDIIEIEKINPGLVNVVYRFKVVKGDE